MTRYGLCLVVFILMAVACMEEKRPSGVLSREEYAAFLIDVYLTEARLSQLPIPSDSAMRLYLAHEPELLGRNGLTDSIVKLTYQYYVSHPTELQEVYTAVIDTLSLREQKANAPTP